MHLEGPGCALWLAAGQAQWAAVVAEGVCGCVWWRRGEGFGGGGVTSRRTRTAGASWSMGGERGVQAIPTHTYIHPHRPLRPPRPPTPATATTPTMLCPLPPFSDATARRVSGKGGVPLGPRASGPSRRLHRPAWRHPPPRSQFSGVGPGCHAEQLHGLPLTIAPAEVARALVS